ncbi:MAG: hypothetical protein LC733_11515, partial [Actinobacteria bacterium]|nr:hypothetical protein [Actinomycetota bacterium]
MKLRRVSLLCAVLAGLALLPWNATSAAPLKEPEVDAAVQVTADPSSGRGHAVPVLAVHPDEPQTLALAEGEAYSSRCMVHISRNGGLT